ncbi:MAG: zinc dependent phospholipase C family protein [Chloroflexota bacterium]|nr:MAG: zinc dependent phospholipase C family protein [Chloroflexota bacterium]
MPTPFYHLRLAQEIAEDRTLSPGLQRFLQAYMGPFLLGNTAPDVHSLSGLSRQETHFFSVPARGSRPAPWRQMLLQYPGLNQVGGLSPEQAAFIAGYLCHLQADWVWVLDIFQPVFGPQLTWKRFSERLYLHNVLRAYLDLEVLADLPPGIPQQLHVAAPDRWLPFVEDPSLVRWRDFLWEQLRPGEAVKTVEVFASRQGIDPEKFHALLESEEEMEANIFRYLPRGDLAAYRRRVVAANLKLLLNYLPEGIVAGDSSNSAQPFEGRTP